MKILKWTFIGMMLLGACAGGFAFWVLYGSKTSNPYNYATVGSIAAPWGYERISGDDAAYTNYLRSIPLMGRGSKCNSIPEALPACSRSTMR